VAAKKDWGFTPGEWVVLTKIPPGLLHGLPSRDQRAIHETVGKRIRFNEYDSDGRAELMFRDRHGVIHFVYVMPSFIEPWRD
jgi:hypothetical protein